MEEQEYQPEYATLWVILMYIIYLKFIPILKELSLHLESIIPKNFITVMKGCNHIELQGDRYECVEKFLQQRGF